MLYALYDHNRAIVAPLADMAHALSSWAHQFGSAQSSAALELMYRVGKDYPKPEFGLSTACVNGREVSVEERCIATKPFCRLIHFAKSVPLTKPKVLLVAPLSGHHSTLLRDTVRALLQDHDVYITDWTDARQVPLSAGAFHLDDYIFYVQDFIRLLAPDLHVISVCQPTVPVLAAISLMATANDPAVPRSMTMMGGPIDARISPTQVNLLATKKDFSWFENSLIHAVPVNHPGVGRRVYPGFLQHYAFLSMNTERHQKSHLEFYNNLAESGESASTEAHRQFYNEYNAVLDLPAEFYLDTIKTVFQEFHLPRGTLEVAGNPVRPQDITGVSLLTVEGELDDIAGLGQTQAAHTLCSGISNAQRQHLVVAGAGHFGIFSGRRWHAEVCPAIAKFIRGS